MLENITLAISFYIKERIKIIIYTIIIILYMGNVNANRCFASGMKRWAWGALKEVDEIVVSFHRSLNASNRLDLMNLMAL